MAGALPEEGARKSVRFKSEGGKPLSKMMTMPLGMRFLDFPGFPFKAPSFSGCSSKMYLLITTFDLEEPPKRNPLADPRYWLVGPAPITVFGWIVGVNGGGGGSTK